MLQDGGCGNAERGPADDFVDGRHAEFRPDAGKVAQNMEPKDFEHHFQRCIDAGFRLCSKLRLGASFFPSLQVSGAEDDL